MFSEKGEKRYLTATAVEKNDIEMARCHLCILIRVSCSNAKSLGVKHYKNE